MIDSRFLQRGQSFSARYPVALNDSLRVQPLGYELLCFTQEFCCQNTDAGRAVADLVILDFRDIDEDLCGWIIQRYALQNRCSIVRDDNIASTR